MTRDVPAHIETYVEVLGEDLAIEFFLQFGGSEVYFSKSPRNAMMVGLTGREKAVMLSEYVGPGHVRVPIPKQWIASVLLERGHSKADIARTLHADQTTVRRWLAKAPDKNQLSLFDT